VSRSQPPAIQPSSSTPASSASPPVPVTVSAIRAPCRASARCCQKPISRNDDRLVSSQNTASRIRLSDSAMPSIEPWNASSSAKKRAVRSSGDRYQRA
jgi:hypothetical protein